MIDKLKTISWDGYLRKDNKKGIRNKILIIYTVMCSSFVAKEIGRLKNDNDIEVIGFDGCYDNAYAIRLINSMIDHPNVGAVLSIGLGCEYLKPSLFSKRALDQGKPSEWFYIQDKGGTSPSISYGLSLIDILKEKLKKTKRVEMFMSDLIIGAECGGSDYTSGLAGNLIVGKFFDLLCDLGGCAIFEEIVECIGLKEQLVQRAIDGNAKKQLSFTYDKALDYCKSVRQYSISPGNFDGGLSTIEEKSMGAFIKSGSKKINGVIKVSEYPEKRGLWLLDTTPDPYWMSFGYTNPNDNEGLIDLISCGSHICFLITGRGNVVGNVVSPVIKITGNSKTYQKMICDMDFDAGTILTGEQDFNELTLNLTQLVIKVASGELCKAEKLNHKEFFIPYKYQNKKLCKSKL